MFIASIVLVTIVSGIAVWIGYLYRQVKQLGLYSSVMVDFRRALFLDENSIIFDFKKEECSHE